MAVRKRARLAAALLAGVSAPALAQTVDVPVPSPRAPVDGNGVDLSRGWLTFDDVALSIGQGRASLGFVRHWIGFGWRHDYVGTISVPGPGPNGATVTTVSIGDAAWSFRRNGTAWVSREGNGATLLAPASGSTLWTLTTSDGMRATFDAAPMANQASYGGKAAAVLSVLVRPDGERLDFAYKRDSYDRGVYMNGEYYDIPQYLVRLQSVRNSYGFQLKFRYQSADPYQPDAWARLERVTAINNAVDYCDPTADGCAVSQPWPNLVFTGAETRGSGETVTDALSRTTSYARVANSFALASITGPRSGAAATNIGYGGDGRVASVTRADTGANYTWSETATASGADLSATITDALGHAQRVVTDVIQGVVREQADALGRTDRFTYDASGQLLTATSRTGVVASYTRDTRGNVTGTTITPAAVSGQATPAAITTAASYDACTATNARTCNQPRTTTDALGNVTDYYYATDGSHAGPERIVYPAPRPGEGRPEVRYLWSPQTARYLVAPGQLGAGTASVWLPTGTSSCPSGNGCVGSSSEVRGTVGYADPNNAGGATNLLPRTVTRGSGDGALQAVSLSGYDAVGNLVSVDGPLPGSADVVRVDYDAARQPVQATGPDPDGGGPLRNRSVRWTRNADGQVTTTEAGVAWPDGSGFSALQASTTDYDALGRATASRLAMGGTVFASGATAWDRANRVTCRVQRMNRQNLTPGVGACALGPQGADGPDRLTTYTYTDADELAQVTSAAGTSLSQVTQAIARDGFGRVTTLTDANGNATAYGYDGFDRPFRTTYPNGSYEQATYDAAGRVTAMRLRDGQQMAYGWDALGRAREVSRPGTALNETSQAFGYDDLGRMTVATDSAGRQLLWDHDALGRVTAERAGGNTLGGATTYGYDLAGRRTSLGWGDGVTVLYERLVTGELSAVREAGGGGGFGGGGFGGGGGGGTLLASYAWDDLGRRTGLSRGNGATTAWGYGGGPWLTSIVHDLAGTAQDVTKGFTRSAAGEILSATLSNDAYAYKDQVAVDRSYARNALNQYTSAGPQSFGYDGRGNLTSEAGPNGNTSYAYTADGLLVSAGSASFAYDPMNRLYRQGASGTILRYAGEDAVTEMDTSGNVRRRYVPGDGTDEPILWYEGAGTGDRRWYHQDERGSVVALSDANANASGRVLTYDPYGIPGAGNAAVESRYGYTGQTWLREIGAWHYKARTYSATLGRFLQPDPIGYADGMNLYAYVGGDPVNATDPDGLQVKRLPPTPANTKRIDGTASPSEIIVRGQRIATVTMTGNLAAIGNGSFGLMRAPGVDAAYTDAQQNNQPKPRSVDYCGSAGSEGVPDGVWGGACKKHDDCYATAGANKERCDVKLAWDITVECSGRIFIPAACALVGVTYTAGLTLAGMRYAPWPLNISWKAFDAGQKSARSGGR